MRISDWSSDVCSSDLFMPRITRARNQPAPSTRPSAAPDAHRERAPRGSTSPKPRATAPLARGRPARDTAARRDRKIVVEGKRVEVRRHLGERRTIKKKKQPIQKIHS